MFVKDNPPRCHIPWQEVNIDVDGGVTPCCNWLSHNNKNELCGNINDQSLLEIWNGPVYQKLRKYMSEGNLEAAGCAKCTLMQQGFSSPFRYDPAVILELKDNNSEQLTAYAKNISLLFREITNGTTVLSAPPTVLSVTPAYSCNLKCVHCYQAHCRTNELKNPEILLKQIQDLIPVLVIISCGGGEPLLLPFWKDFLREGDFLSNPYLTFSMCTNATLLSQKILEQLDLFKSVQIGVSFDAGTKEVYEKVRRKANFNLTTKNIDKLINLAGTKDNSYVSISMSVMRENITDLVNFIRFAAQKRIHFALSPVLSFPPEQALTSFNDAHNDLRMWGIAIEKALELIDNETFSNSLVHPPQNYKSQIEFIKRNIPWHLSSQKMLFCKGKIPAQFLKETAVGCEPGSGLILLFWPKSDDENTDKCQFFSVLDDDNTFEVHLPPGNYFCGIVSPVRPPSFNSGWDININRLGRIIWKKRSHGNKFFSILKIAKGEIVRFGNSRKYALLSTAHQIYHFRKKQLFERLSASLHYVQQRLNKMRVLFSYSPFLFAMLPRPASHQIAPNGKPLEIVMLVVSDLRIDPRVFREAQALASAGFRVKIIVPDISTPPLSEVPLDWGPAVEFILLPFKASNYIFSFPFLLGRLILERAIQEKPFAFHCHDLTTAITGLAAARKVGALCICDFHEWWSENVVYDCESKRYVPHPRKEKRFFQLAERLAVSRADAVVTVCNSIAEDLSRATTRGRRKIHVIRNIPPITPLAENGQNSLREQLSLSDEQMLLLWQGGTGIGRNIEPIIESLVYAPNVTFVIRGPSLDMFGKGYRTIAERIGASNRLILLDPIPSAEVVRGAVGADIGAWSLERLCKNFTYALPNKVFEYLAAGVPVIGASFPEVRKLIEGHGVGMCFDPDDPKSIGTTLRHLSENPQLRQEMRQNIPMLLKSLNAEEEWLKMVDLYKELSATK